MTLVLVVDDDEMFARMVTRQVEKIGLTAASVHTPRDALSFVESTPPDVALVDLHLSDSDYNGIRLIGMLRSRAPDLQAVLMSAQASARDYKEAVQRGAVEVLVKPFSRDELRAALDRAIACTHGIHGEVHGLTLVEILQMYHFSRRPVSLLFDGADTFIDMREGDIVHAVAEGNEGEEALVDLLARPAGAVRTAVPQSGTRSIRRSFDAVLLDALRIIDERTGPHAIAQDLSTNSDPFDIWDDADLALDEVVADNENEFPDQPKEEEGETRMSKIDDSCKQVVDNTDGGIACGVVDLDTGMLLGIHNTAQYSQSLNEIVAAAAVDMFRGANVGRIQKAVRKHRGLPEDGAHYIEEVQFSSKNNYHFCKAMKGGKAVIILVTNKSTNVGMGWAQLKSVIPDVEPLVP